MTGAQLETLLIGYGNEWCGDDGLGPLVARLVDGLSLPHVRVLAVPQLTPDLAEPLSLVNRALFVDSSITTQRLPITIEPLSPNGIQSSLTHSCSPETLLALAHLLYGRSPTAWIMTIAGSRFCPGDALSDLAQQYAREAASRIENWLQSSVADPCCLESTV